MNQDAERDFYLGSRNPVPTIKMPTDYDVLVIPDVHSYERDHKAYDLLFNKVFPNLNDSYNIKQVIQLGDLLECGELSRYGQSNVDEKVHRFEDEIQWAVSDFWNPLKSYFPKAKLSYVEGNHEFRWHSWALKNIPKDNLVKSMFNQLSVCDIFENHGIEVAPYGGEDVVSSSIAITKDLHCVHGWSFAKHSAHTHLDKMMGSRSVLFGHTHRIQSHIRRDPFSQKLVGAWSFGALAKTNMFYEKGQPNDHALGFGLVHIRKDQFAVSTNTILDTHNRRSVILPNGEFYEQK